MIDEEKLHLLDMSNIPLHIAIIPDGNRRWAKNNAFQIIEGHRQGADKLIAIVKSAKNIGIKFITFFLFSTENWLRDQTEVDALMWLLETFLIDQRQTMIDNDIRFNTIGDLSKFSGRILDLIHENKQSTSHCNAIQMIAALNYGGRDDLSRAVKRLVEDYDSKILSEPINENLISRYLDTAPWPDPELLIRTSGEHRISNFLLWQISYSELYMADVLWPDFTDAHFLDAILTYQSRDRRLGG
jgi:undecaprenyl diphosphate synthase